MANKPSVPAYRPQHGYTNIDNAHNNGFYTPREAYFVVSGTLSDVQSHTTGTISFNLHTYAAKLKRFETFHSGSATSFNISVESSTPNTGSAFDPRHVIVTYNNLQTSNDFSTGVDQVEDLVVLTDQSGSLYVKFIPKGTGLNTFKYLIFFESAYVIVG
jgi:hypothetical protein